MNTNSTLKVAVGMVKKLRATISSLWLLRKAFHVGEEGLRVRGRYLLYRRFGHVDTELVECADNAGRTPRGIGSPHVLDELADVSGNGGATRLTSVAETSPVIPEPSLLPGDDGTGLDERQCLLPAQP